MTELIFDLDGRAITLSIVAPREAGPSEAGTPALGTPAPGTPAATWLLHARWDDEDRSRTATAPVHAHASLEDFSHRGLTRIVRRLIRTQ